MRAELVQPEGAGVLGRHVRELEAAAEGLDDVDVRERRVGRVGQREDRQLAPGSNLTARRSARTRLRGQVAAVVAGLLGHHARVDGVVEERREGERERNGAREEHGLMREGREIGQKLEGGSQRLSSRRE